MQEIWKDIKGYEGKYQVSNLGHARSLDRQIKIRGKNQVKSYECNKIIRGKLLKLKETKYGYIQMLARNKKETKYLYIHRLVAETFIPNPENKPHVNHIDSNKKNNCVSNLEWVTPKENVTHSVVEGNRKSEITELYTKIRYLEKENKLLREKLKED